MKDFKPLLVPFYIKAIIGPTVIMSGLAYALSFIIDVGLGLPLILLFSLLGSTITVIGFHILLFSPIIKSAGILRKFSSRDFDEQKKSKKMSSSLTKKAFPLFMLFITVPIRFLIF